jgi:hypothetical protein
MPLDEVRVQLGRGERRMAQHRQQEPAVGRDPRDPEPLQRPDEPGDGLVARRAVGDDLGEHRIVVHPDLAPARDPGVPANAGQLRRRPQQHGAGRRQEVARRILGIQPGLDRVPVEADRALLEGQRPSLGHLDLETHQVESGHELGHRVLHLEPGVHFEEVERATRRQHELDGAGPDIADGGGGGDRGAAHALAQRLAHGRRRRLLDHLLVPALDRALALEQVHDTAVRVTEDLQLDVARALDVALHQQRVVAEGGEGLAARRCERPGERRSVVHHTHALPATPGRRLHQEGQADRERLAGEALVVEPGTGDARNHGHARRGHDALRLDLAPHGTDRRRRRSDEEQPLGGAALGELGVLRQEAVAGMHGLGPRRPRGGEQTIDREVRLAAGRRPDPHCLVRLAHVRRRRIRIGVDRDTGDAHEPQRAEHAPGDLAAVRDQDLADARHGGLLYGTRAPT